MGWMRNRSGSSCAGRVAGRRCAAWLTVCLALFGGVDAAWADEVRLVNGDRLTGTVVSLERGVLKFDTPHGSLSVPWGEVVELAIEAAIEINPPSPAFTVTGVRILGGDVSGPDGWLMALSDLHTLTRPSGPQVTGGLNVGFLSTAGNTEVTTVRLDGEMVRRARSNRYTASGVVNRGHDATGPTARNATGSARYDRFFSPRFYANATALLTTDRFRDLDLRSALGVALGYQVADAARVRFGVESGYGYVREQFTGSVDQGFHAIRETTSVDVYVVGQRVVLFHRHDGFFGVAGNRRRFVQTRNGLRVGLMGNLVMTLQYDVDHDPSPSPGRTSTDQATGVTFGYRF